MVLDSRSGATGVGVDFSPPMPARAHERFAADDRATIPGRDLGDPLPALGVFEAVIPSFAIHHLEDARNRELLGEIRCLPRTGVFANLEHVASPTP